ncbi:UNVERIFIED_CONTAM: hypothetical protein K2H54_040542 [Gekko kuhli]
MTIVFSVNSPNPLKHSQVLSPFLHLEWVTASELLWLFNRPVKIAGKWYPIALLMDKAEAFPSDPAHQVVVPSENGDLLFKYTFMKEGKCETREVPLHHTDKPGKFLSRDRTSTLRMVEVDYDSCYILHDEMQNALSVLDGGG